MKAYKIVKKIKGRYFSANAVEFDVRNIINGVKKIGDPDVRRILEYVPREATVNGTDLFIFDNYFSALCSLTIFLSSEIWECDVDEVRETSNIEKDNDFNFPRDTRFCRSVTLIKKVY